ncbi:MAG: alkaline phosphatase family protein, partial [Acidobacteriota bacterium]
MIIIDIDGLPRAAFGAAMRAYPEKTQNFRRILGEPRGTWGYERTVVFRGATTVFPTVTFAAQASIFTGVYPRRHGITGNRWHDRLGASCTLDTIVDYVGLSPLGTFLCVQSCIYGHGIGEACARLDFLELAKCDCKAGMANKHLLAPTVYDAALQAGKSAAVIFNMYFKSHAGLHYKAPNLGDTAWFVIGEAERKKLGWIAPDIFALTKYDGEAIDEAEELVTGKRLPDILTIYLPGFDVIGHNYGLLKAIDYLAEKLDTKIGEFLRKLDVNYPNWTENTLFVITSDHGRTEVSTNCEGVGTGVEMALKREGFDPQIQPPDRRNVQIGWNDGMAHIYVRGMDSRWVSPPSEVDVLRVAQVLADDAGQGRALETYVGAVAYRRKFRSNYEVRFVSPELHSELSDKLGLLEKANLWFRSGDVLLLLKPGCYFGEKSGAHHGSIWDGDLRVPLLVAGGLIEPAVNEETDWGTVNIARTVAEYFGFKMNTAERSLPLSLRVYDKRPTITLSLGGPVKAQYRIGETVRLKVTTTAGIASASASGTPKVSVFVWRQSPDGPKYLVEEQGRLVEKPAPTPISQPIAPSDLTWELLAVPLTRSTRAGDYEWRAAMYMSPTMSPATLVHESPPLKYTVLAQPGEHPSVISVKTTSKLYRVDDTMVVQYSTVAGSKAGKYDLMLRITASGTENQYYFYDNPSDTNRWIHQTVRPLWTGEPRDGDFQIPSGNMPPIVIEDDTPSGDFIMRAYFSEPGKNTAVGNWAETKFELKTPAGEQCFIASAAWGSPTAEPVEVLRGFRDRHLAPWWWGRELVRAYYTHGPRLAARVSPRPAMRKAARIVLWPAVGFAALALRLNLWAAALAAALLAAGLALLLRRASDRVRLALLALALAAASQAAEIRGTVVRARPFPIPVPAARIELDPTGRVAASDQDGAFRFDNVAAGQYTLKASAVGFLAASV